MVEDDTSPNDTNRAECHDFRPNIGPKDHATIAVPDPRRDTIVPLRAKVPRLTDAVPWKEQGLTRTMVDMETLEELRPELRHAELRETHVSTVFLTSDHVYKLKKPVALAFLDFRDLDARRQACEREVELNRRIAPDVYLDTLEVRNRDGTVFDYLVKMRRLPDARCLTNLVASGADIAPEIRLIARRLVTFHGSAPRSSEIDAAATPEAIRELWCRTVDELLETEDLPVDPDTVYRIATLVERYIAGRRKLFQQRIAQNHICDGHGDLLANDIFCLDTGPQILDCIEFDDRLRFGDVLSDLAFLAMDLELLHRPDLARGLFNAYTTFSGEHHPASLAHFYIAYRALVRCKVAIIRRHQTGNPADTVEAYRLLFVAADHMERARSIITMIGGLPGTGKSTLAGILGNAFGWVVVSSDEVRRDVAGVGRNIRSEAGFEQGLYTPEFSEATYSEMTRRCRDLVQAGECVILDASFARSAWRDAIRNVARDCNAELVELHVVAPADLARQRIEQRRHSDHISDATSAIAAKMAQIAEAWPAAPRIDTTAEVPHCINSAVHVIARTGVDRMPWTPETSTRKSRQAGGTR